MKNQIQYEINRSAFIITPKQEFFDMLASLNKDQVFKAEDITKHDSSTVYLVSADFFDPDEAMKYLKKNFTQIFELEMDGWIDDPELWPKNVTWKQFQNWFSINFQSMVFDIENNEPIYEEF